MDNVQYDYHSGCLNSLKCVLAYAEVEKANADQIIRFIKIIIKSEKKILKEVSK